MNIKPLLLACFCFVGLPIITFSQAKKRKLPANINRLTIKNHAPFVSGDGNSLLYLCDYNNEKELSLRHTSKVSMSSWKEPKDVSGTANSPKVAYQGGYSLNFDGSVLYYTFRKHPSVGGYDIWYSTRQGNGWSEAQNLGKPTNTTANEGAPSLSADGKYMYFMRCEQMSHGNASGCQLYVSEKKGRSWSVAKALPAHINQGNTAMPRILADGKTLIFSSDRPGGKGGMDFYQTKKEGETWSQPVAMDFINTAKDEMYISIPSKGRYLYHTVDDGRGGAYIEELLIPAAFKPSKVMRIQGQVMDASTQAPVQAKVKAYTTDTRARVWDDVTNSKGEFVLVVEEGAHYDFSIESKQGGYNYFSKLYDLESMKYSKRDELEVSLQPLKSRQQIPLDNVLFDEHSTSISNASAYELRRLVRLIKNNPEFTFEFGLGLAGYRQDSLQSDPDLTEVIIDTLYQEIPMDTLSYENEAEQDMTSYEGDENSSDSVDDMAEGSEMDTELMEADEAPEERPFVLKYTYHNDRTERQAASLMEYLDKKGIAEDRVRFKNYRSGEVEAGEPAKTSVMVKIL